MRQTELGQSDGVAKQSNDVKKFRIFNIRTNELLSLNATLEDLNTIMLALLKGKFKKQEVKTDEEFIAECKEAIN